MCQVGLPAGLGRRALRRKGGAFITLKSKLVSVRDVLGQTPRFLSREDTEQ